MAAHDRGWGTNVKSYRRSEAKRICWIALLLFSGHLGAASEMPAGAPPMGPCPDLSGTYHEDGTTLDRGKSKADAHLSWMIGGGKEKSARRPLSDMPNPPAPITYYVKSIRISHPAAEGFVLEAFDHDSESLGLFHFDSADGWKCGNGAFVRYLDREIGGEGYWSDQVSITRLFRTGDGTLVRSIEIWNAKRSILAFGARVGTPEKITDVEYRFEPIK